MVVDSHHHFWRYDPAQHGWIDPATMGRLARDFLRADLLEETRSAGVDAVVSVQASQSIGETQWMLDYAASTPEIAGVVGWAPLAEPDIGERLSAIAHPLLEGLRHVVQDEPDDRFLWRGDFNLGVAALELHGLVYDILVLERQLTAAVEFVDRHPEQPFVLDHLAKPRIAEGALEPWRSNLMKIAQRANVVCKISGVVTEADWSDWSLDRIRPYLDTALEAFGPERLMFGFDWPACLLATSYAEWKRVVEDWSATLSPRERHRLFAGTAIEAYGLDMERASR